jgi:hypothetical protein
MAEKAIRFNKMDGKSVCAVVAVLYLSNKSIGRVVSKQKSCRYEEGEKSQSKIQTRSSKYAFSQGDSRSIFQVLFAKV